MGRKGVVFIGGGVKNVISNEFGIVLYHVGSMSAKSEDVLGRTEESDEESANEFVRGEKRFGFFVENIRLVRTGCLRFSCI